MSRWLQWLTDPYAWMIVLAGLVFAGHWWDLHDELTPVIVPLAIVLVYLHWRGRGKLPPASGAPAVPEPVPPPSSPWQERMLRPVPALAFMVVVAGLAAYGEASGFGPVPVLAAVALVGGLVYGLDWLWKRNRRRIAAGSDTPGPTV